jgi:hypothetical protein
MKAPEINQVEFEESDFGKAERIARRLGYDQTAYTSTSALWGLFCLRSRPTQKAGCIIKTAQFGFLFVQDLEDLNLEPEDYA